MRQATRAYDAIVNKTANPRELEADLLLNAAARLQAIRDGWANKNPELDAALLFNRKLWSVFVTSATSPEIRCRKFAAERHQSRHFRFQADAGRAGRSETGKSRLADQHQPGTRGRPYDARLSGAA